MDPHVSRVVRPKLSQLCCKELSLHVWHGSYSLRSCYTCIFWERVFDGASYPLVVFMVFAISLALCFRVWIIANSRWARMLILVAVFGGGIFIWKRRWTGPVCKIPTNTSSLDYVLDSHVLALVRSARSCGGPSMEKVQAFATPDFNRSRPQRRPFTSSSSCCI